MEEQDQQTKDQPAATEQPLNGAEKDLVTTNTDLEAQIAQFKDMLLRKAAEFENFKRRSEEQTSNIIKFANEEIIEAFLPVVDDLERSLKHGKETPDFDALYKGIELILQKLMKTLDQHGVRPLVTLGTEFSVNLHEALMQVPRSDVAPHTVIDEVEKGYTLHDKVLRHAKVIVSAEAQPSEGTAA